MKKPILVSVLAVAICGLSAQTMSGQETSTAPPSSATGSELVSEALSLSGFSRQLEQVPVIAQALWSEQKDSLSPESYEELGEAFAEAYSLDSLHRGLVEKVAEKVDDELLRRVLERYKDPLFLSIVESEYSATTPQGLAGIKEFAAGLEKVPLANDRVLLMERLEGAVGTTELMADATVILFRDLVDVNNVAASPDGRREAAEVESRLEEMNLQLTNQLRMVNFIQHLYAYRDIPDEDLASYLDFWSSEDASWLRQSARNGLLETLEDRSEGFGHYLEKVAKDLVPGPGPGDDDAADGTSTPDGEAPPS